MVLNSSYEEQQQAGDEALWELKKVMLSLVEAADSLNHAVSMDVEGFSNGQAKLEQIFMLLSSEAWGECDELLGLKLESYKE